MNSSPKVTLACIVVGLIVMGLIAFLAVRKINETSKVQQDQFANYANL